MTLTVLGIDALDPDLISTDEHPNLTLEHHCPIETISSHAGEPSTHELWPTIITGLEPREHGLVLSEGVAWENPLLRLGSSLANYVLPDRFQTRLGSWLLNETSEDAFRVSADYYTKHGIETVLDSCRSKPIGIPNYVVNSEDEDREHQLRRSMGNLFERDPAAKGGHTSSDPSEFYERCLEMSMVRIARTRRALRGRRYELVFGYTSGLDLIGHVSYDSPGLQRSAYAEMDEFVGELRRDLGPSDELLLVSDHGLQDGLHTDDAMVASTSQSLIADVESVTDVAGAILTELSDSDHTPTGREFGRIESGASTETVRDQLEDLGYL